LECGNESFQTPGVVPAGLADILTTTQIVSRNPDMTELMFC